MLFDLEQHDALTVAADVGVLDYSLNDLAVVIWNGSPVRGTQTPTTRWTLFFCCSRFPFLPCPHQQRHPFCHACMRSPSLDHCSPMLLLFHPATNKASCATRLL